MARIIKSFDRYGLFDKSGQRASDPYASVEGKISDWYKSFNDIAYGYCEGDVQKAEHFLDCSVYMFYWRMVQKKDYIEKYNESIKKAQGKTA